MNFDGGFGVIPGSESHAGQVRQVGIAQYFMGVVISRYTAVWARWQFVKD